MSQGSSALALPALEVLEVLAAAPETQLGSPDPATPGHTLEAALTEEQAHRAEDSDARPKTLATPSPVGVVASGTGSSSMTTTATPASPSEDTGHQTSTGTGPSHLVAHCHEQLWAAAPPHLLHCGERHLSGSGAEAVAAVGASLSSLSRRMSSPPTCRTIRGSLGTRLGLSFPVRC